MVDPWDADEPQDTPEARRARDAIERTLGSIFSSERRDCSLDELTRALRTAGFRFGRVHVVCMLQAMSRARGAAIAFADGRIHSLL